MKQPLALILIVLITIVSWSSCAKNKTLNITTIYNLSYPVAPSSILMPSLRAPDTQDSLIFPQINDKNKHNSFFEYSIIFNENLQQIISYFTQPNNERIWSKTK